MPEVSRTVLQSSEPAERKEEPTEKKREKIILPLFGNVVTIQSMLKKASTISRIFIVLYLLDSATIIKADEFKTKWSIVQ